jgi:hypothetical protein
MTQFECGDDVRVDSSAPSLMRPGELGSVSGVRSLTDEGVFNGVWLPQNTVLFLVEFSDGKAVEIPGAFLSAE